MLTEIINPMVTATYNDIWARLNFFNHLLGDLNEEALSILSSLADEDNPELARRYLKVLAMRDQTYEGILEATRELRECQLESQQHKVLAEFLHKVKSDRRKLDEYR